MTVRKERGILEQVSERNIAEVRGFLARHEESAQFLINNLREHGATLSEHKNSGNFKALRVGGEIVGVFCLARRGNVYVQLSSPQPEIILDACANEAIGLKGFVGDWNSVEPVYRLFKERNPTFVAGYESKEILYSKTLRKGDREIAHDARVRLLTPADFSRWIGLRRAFLLELGVPSDGSDEQMRSDFESAVASKCWWGLFQGNDLVAQTALNSKGDTVGQVGGVFTQPALRKRGLARAVMFHMLKDCRDFHGHTKSILFTGETDFPAQKLYESMGYARIGFFALVLS
jgi:predicted GNAT family acetyltransferase